MYQCIFNYHTIVSAFVWTQYWNVTDGQTDRIPLAVTVLCIAMRMRCKKHVILHNIYFMLLYCVEPFTSNESY